MTFSDCSNPGSRLPLTVSGMQAAAPAEEDRPPEGPATVPDSGTDGAQEPVREMTEARGEASDVSMRSASEPVTSSQMGDIPAAEAVIPPEPAAEPPATDGDIAEASKLDLTSEFDWVPVVGNVIYMVVRHSSAAWCINPSAYAYHLMYLHGSVLLWWMCCK